MENLNNFQQQYKNQKKQNSPINMDKLNKLFVGVGIIIAAGVLIVILIASFTFTVNETEQAAITQFDKIVKIIVDDINSPSIQALKEDPRFANIKVQQGKGLFFKIPFIQSVKQFSNKLFTYDTSAEEVTTRDKKTIFIDNFAQWKINNPATFMVNIGTREAAHQRIDEVIYSKMREEIGKIDAHVLIADKEYMFNMLLNVENYVNDQLQAYGVEIVDIRIKRTEFPDETKPSIYEQMRSEREAVASKYRADGQKDARTIRAEANNRATVIKAQAYEQAQKLMGEGDAEALKIYAEAYNVDPEFYEFWKTLQTYKEVIDDDTTIIISPDSVFAKYIYGN
ncbi:MAG: protease modulator HflC [Acetivibrionales bacterium]|jgi:membrane protease subunit HflC